VAFEASVNTPLRITSTVFALTCAPPLSAQLAAVANVITCRRLVPSVLR
jgi:hypothetical protein